MVYREYVKYNMKYAGHVRMLYNICLSCYFIDQPVPSTLQDWQRVRLLTAVFDVYFRILRYICDIPMVYAYMLIFDMLVRCIHEV